MNSDIPDVHMSGLDCFFSDYQIYVLSVENSLSEYILW